LKSNFRLIFTTEASQGALLGISFTDPLSFFVGGIGGLIYALWRRSASAYRSRRGISELGQ